MAILMLGILILVHEFGHYLTGRLLKFKIEEFSVGMGPKIVSKEKKGIRYSLRAIPMGGFVAFHGEDGEADDPEAMTNKPWWKRAIVMFAGAGFNVLFSFLLTAILVCAVGYYAPQMASFTAEAPVAETLKEGDLVIGLNDHIFVSSDEFGTELAKIDKEDAFTLNVLRDGKKITVPAQKYWDEENQKYMLGVTYSYGVVRQNPIQALGYSARYNVWMTKTMYVTLWELVTGKHGLEDVTGPVSTIGAIGGLVKDAATVEDVSAADRARTVVVMITELLVIISMNLAIMNLLPIPALDGFRLLFCLIEGITGKHIPRNVEGMINGIGLLALLGLMVVLEVSKLFV